jgi:RiboL-PSP-HEPN
MTSRAATVALASLDEIIDNSYLRDATIPWLVRNAGAIQSAIGGGDNGRQFSDILAKRRTDPGAAFQGSIVLLSSVLEAYLSSIVDEYLTTVSSKINESNYEKHDTLIRNYTARSGFALQYILSGNFLGAAFDFGRLKKNLAKNLADNDEFEMVGDIFMIRFGTCYPEKIEKLFQKLGLPGPFDANLGKHKSISSWAKDRSPTSAALYMRTLLDDMATLRNDLAHGHPTAAVTHDHVLQFGDMMRAFVSAIDDRLLPGLV